MNIESVAIMKLYKIKVYIVKATGLSKLSSFIKDV